MLFLLFTLSSSFFFTLLTLVQAKQYDMAIPLYGAGGICSDDPVTQLDFKATCQDPGATLIATGNVAAFEALKTANLSDPEAISRLPPIIANLSCLDGPVKNCEKSFPPGRRLFPQRMCVFIKNDGVNLLNCSAEINFILNLSNSSNASTHNPHGATESNTEINLQIGRTWFPIAMAVLVATQIGE